MRSSLAVRLLARMRAAQYDRQLAVGVTPKTGSALAAHRARITSTAERHALARSLHRILRDARTTSPVRASMNVENIAAAEDVLDRVTVRLRAPRPVCSRGMARLRLVLADGTGPLYRCGSGDLRGRLGAALAEL
jgi:hypothetical protein